MGHRPHKFPWRYDETNSQCIKLKELLSHLVALESIAGITDFYSGMADGSDMWLSQIVLMHRSSNPAIKLHCVLPCEGQADKWSVSAQERYHTVLEQADSITYVSREYYNGCMLERNRRLVDSAHNLIAVYNGEQRGGTAATIRYARKMKKTIWIINPVTLQLTQETPE